MWVVKTLFQNVIFAFFKWFFQTFRLPGILCICLVAEIIGLEIYTSDEVAVSRISSEFSQIVNAVCMDEKSVTSSDFYTYDVTVQNPSTMHNYENGVHITNEDGNLVAICRLHLPYEEADGWGGAHEGVYLPAGMQTTYRVLIDKNDLMYEDGNTFYFAIDYLDDDKSKFQFTIAK